MSKRVSASRSGETLNSTPNLIPRIGRLGVGLCLAMAAFAAPAAVTNLLQSSWNFHGSGAVAGGTLTVGDNIGYDTSDSDGDGNPYNLLFGSASTTATSGQGVDYDEAVTVAEFSPPFKLSWTGCFPATSYGYNNIFLGRKNPSYTGAAGSKQYLITQEFGFSARWDYSGLNSVVLNAGNYDIQKVSAAALSGNNYCGDYRIDWANDQLEFYFNDTKIRTQKYPFIGPVSILVRSFERPHSITAMTLDSGVTTAQQPATSQGLASIYGANISGTMTGGGATTTLDTSNTSISGDASFAINAAGDLIVHISGMGASQGMAFRYEVDYDAVTMNLTGKVRDNTDNTPRDITFTNKGGLVWEARVQAGTGKNSSGTATTYDIVFNIVLPPESITMGSKFPANGRVNVDLGQTQQVSFPISVPLLNLNTTVSTSIITEGLMVVSLVPNSQGSFTVTGNVQGSFRMDQPIQVSTQFAPLPGIPAIPIDITVDATGRFSGVMTGDTAKNNLRFSGNWSAVAGDGGTAGGTLDMPIPLDPTTYATPATAELSIAGAVTANTSGVPAAYQSFVPTVATPFSQKVTVPLVFQAPN